MSVNLRLFIKQVDYSLTSPINISARLTPRRVAHAALFLPDFQPTLTWPGNTLFFDKQVSLLQRRKIMRFYCSCLLRNLFARRSVKNSTPKPRLSVRRLIRFSSFSRMPKSSIWCAIHWILSLRKMGLSKKQILETCALVFKHFDFDTR